MFFIDDEVQNKIFWVCGTFVYVQKLIESHRQKTSVKFCYSLFSVNEKVQCVIRTWSSYTLDLRKICEVYETSDFEFFLHVTTNSITYECTLLHHMTKTLIIIHIRAF